MKTITIGFSKPKNHKFPIYSWIIRLLEGTPYSHIYAKFNSKSLDRSLIYEAAGLTVHFIGEKLFNQRAQTIKQFEVQISNENYKKALQFAVDNAEKPYGIKQAVGLGFVILCRRLGIKTKNPFRSGTYDYVCSELVCSMLPKLEKQFRGRLDEVTPRDVEKYLESSC